MTIATLSIDFGNTNTVVAVETDLGEIKVLNIPAISTQNPLASYENIEIYVSSVPSEVFFRDGVRIGKQAYRTVDALRDSAAYEFFGANFKHEILNAFRVDREYRPDFQAALDNSRSFLQALLGYIAKELDKQYAHPGPIPTVVVSVPVSSPLEYINFMRSSIESSLKYEALQIIDEATCAANYFDSLEQGDNILVIDIGGSTTDLSLVEVNGSISGRPTSILLARHGLRFGGVDIDRLIADYFLKINELGDLQDHSIKTRTRLLKMAEAAKKHLTNHQKFNESRYDPDLAMDISFLIEKDELEALINESYIPSKLTNFFSASRLLIEGAGVPADAIKYMVFVGGTTIQPLVNKILIEALGICGLPVPSYAQNLGVEVFSSVAIGSIRASKVEMIGRDLLNSICLKIDGIYKPIFRKGQTIPAVSREFALGKQFSDQTHVKFRLAELDSFSEVREGYLCYRPITCNGEFYRMEVPSDTIEGEYRFITRFFVDEQLRIYASIKDKQTSKVLHKKVEIGNQTEIGLLSDDDIVSPPFLPPSIEGASSSTGRNQQESFTTLLYSHPENPLEQKVQEEIISYSFKGWLMTGIHIPETPWKPDHILILETGAALILEDKMKSGRWSGATNGPWRCDGEVIECGTSRGVPDENPMKQVQKYREGVERIMRNIGVDTPFIVTTVIAPSDADISRVNLGDRKSTVLVKLSSLYEIVKWIIKKSKQRLEEQGRGLPALDASTIRSEFHIGT
jgi:molecular chaperone DnaK (HSP70)